MDSCIWHGRRANGARAAFPGDVRSRSPASLTPPVHPRPRVCPCPARPRALGCAVRAVPREQGGEVNQVDVVREIFGLVSKRSDTVCNFLEGGSISAWDKDTRLIYRHYATLYFVFAVDQQESELGILDLIQVFVETLDKCFENVCELDLIFHSDKVHYILDEVVMGGMVLETSIGEIMTAIGDMSKLEATTRGMAVKS